MPIPYQELASHLQAFEAENDVFRHQVDGWSVWPLFRMEAVVFSMGGFTSANKERLHYTEAVRCMLRDLPALLTARPSALLVLSLNSARSEQVGDLFKDVFFDDLLQGRKDFLKIEDIENRLFLRQSRAALIPSRASILPFRLFSTLLHRLRLVPASVRKVGNAVSGLLSGSLGMARYTPTVVNHRLGRFYWEKRLYRLLLRRVRPEQLIHIGAHFYELFGAARELGIKVVELQHGFLDRRTHVGYAWGPYARRYKAHLPIAQRLLLFGEHWRRELIADGFWDDDLSVVGSLRVDDFRRRRTEVRREPGMPRFFWTSDGIEVTEAIQFVRAAVRAMGAKARFELTVKLHPHAENRKDMYLEAFADDPRVRVLLGNERPSTFDLLIQADLHLSIASTCHYEAIALGVPTVILPLRTHEKVIDLVKRGHAQLAADPAGLVSAFMQFNEIGVPKGADVYYFRPGALAHLVEALSLTPPLGEDTSGSSAAESRLGRSSHFPGGGGDGSTVGTSSCSLEGRASLSSVPTDSGKPAASNFS